MPTYRIETDQGTFDIDADREPTQQEALQAISGSTGSESILPSVQAARNVAARQTPDTGVAQGKGPLTDLANSFLFNLGRTVYNIPHGIANLVLGASENFDIAPGVNKPLITTPEEFEQAANDRALQEKIRASITEPINEPIMKLGGLTAADLTNPESPTMRYPYAAFGGEVAPDVAMALEGVLRVPSVARAGNAAVESANELGASALKARAAVGQGVKDIVPETRALARKGMRATGTNPIFEKLNLSKTTEEKMINVFSPNPRELEGFISRESGVLPEIKAASKDPIKNYPQLQSAGETAKSNKIEGSLQALEQADNSGLTSPGQDAYKNVQASLEGKGLTEADKAQILTEFEPYNRALKATEAQGVLKTVNSDLGPLYRASFERQGDLLVNARYAAKKAFRDSLSEHVDEIIKSVTGVDQSPYRQYGMINDLLNKAEMAHSRAVIATAKRPAIGIPLKASVSDTAKAVGTMEGGTGRYNNFVRGLFEEVPDLKAPTNLSEETIAGLVKKYTAPQSTLEDSVRAELDALKRSKFYRDAGPATRKSLEAGFLKTLPTQ